MYNIVPLCYPLSLRLTLCQSASYKSTALFVCNQISLKVESKNYITLVSGVHGISSMTSPEDDILVNRSADGATGGGDGESARSSRIVAVRLSGWPKEQWTETVRELLPLLDGKPFRVID